MHSLKHGAVTIDFCDDQQTAQNEITDKLHYSANNAFYSYRETIVPLIGGGVIKITEKITHEQLKNIFANNS